jgi:predicted nuclease of predicted toxin-antitoxin system
MPKILLDQNIPRPISAWMRQRGFNIVTLTDINLYDVEDQEIAAYAAKNNLTILTQDHHFIQIYQTQYRRRLTVVLIKTKEAIPLEILKVILGAHAKIDLHKIQNQLVLASEKKIRVFV